MITGDHPNTAARIAGNLGIAESEAQALSAVLEALDDEALRIAVSRRSVYARVAPEHKLRIVDALQANGQIVAMTGDGVNDACAQGCRHRRRDGHHGDGRDEGGGGHDPRRRQLRHDHERRARRARDLREHP